MDMHLLGRLREELEFNSDQKTKESSKNFFKEPVISYGVKTALVTQIGKTYFKELKGFTKTEIFDLCENLWESGYLEESFVACNWAYALRKNFEPADFDRFEIWIDSYVGNWASCDSFCNHTLGAFIEMYPLFLPKLKQFTLSPNRWMRRAAAVTLILPARHGKFLSDVFEIADLLLSDKDDLVQKGYGWLLKAASEQHQQEVFAYVVRNKAIMPRTALRYAIEKMPSEMRAIAMEK